MNLNKKIVFGKPLIDRKERVAINNILKQPILVHGPKTNEFEKSFSNFTGSKNSITVSSCTAGMHLIYFCLGLGRGDEVIVSSQTHVATAHAIELTGAKAVFIDSNDIDGNIDIKSIENKINKKTKCICIVHYLGIPADIQKISKIAKKYKLFLIEDCALALGSKVKNKHVGLFGLAGVFSFYPVKHITTAEGGMVITNNNLLAKKIKSAKAFSYDKDFSKRKIPGDYNVNNLGFNYRMSEINATLGCEQLKKINKFLSIRKKNFSYLSNLLSKNKFIKILKNTKKSNESSNYCLTIVLKNSSRNIRDKIITNLRKKNIGCSIYYPYPVPLMNYYKKKYKIKKKKFINSSKISNCSIALPVGPHLNKEDMKIISKNLIDQLSIFNKV